MGSVSQADGVLKIQTLTNEHTSDLSRENRVRRTFLLANYITWLEAGSREPISPLPNHKETP